ncbi:hypothetical protein F4V57_13530 [Acinetobacter qingfengensis]|uniref:DUF4870 domain-containing protein n=1 Tax=Acinetobacter qingfengensis TaxID=1262585 RepID=A0A1E7QWU3_9GAMM|nr:hypothetical protein [Acinetobacter qingfengensis]KAA8731318.1 hypothetical protein F4V57_13530 [Acinetobacter qingfengensis]OEY91436.1 hypothetical protein BJI46_06775 [Acinetobacter qingfengensis]
MGQEQQKKQEKLVLVTYLFMLLSIFTIIPVVITYWLAVKASYFPDTEVWLNSHAFWIARNLLIFLCIAVFSALWFIPLAFFMWDQYIWVTACTIAGVVFALIAWLYLVNTWLKGIMRFFKRKPVY